MKNIVLLALFNGDELTVLKALTA